MPPKLRTLLLNLFWLLVTVAVICLIIQLYFGNSTLDIHLHDTYFVIDPVTAYIPLSLLAIVIVFIIKEWRARFSRPFGWWTIIISGSLFILSLTWLAPFANSVDLPSEGWTAYPPLSALSNTHSSVIKTTTDKSMVGLLLLLQAGTLLFLLLAAYRRGTTLSKQQHVH